MKRVEVKIGDKYGRLTVVSELSKKNGDRFFELRCDCGNITNVILERLRSGETKSCGCLKKEIGKLLITHGESRNMANTVEYKTWCSMKDRCYNKNNPKYKNWGGRGIIVCDEWINSYETFLSDMGRKPLPELSIERKDVNKNYCKENCIWGDDEQQRNNRTDSHFIEYLGEIKTVAQWAKLYNISTSNFHTRLKSCNFNLEIYNLKWQTNLTSLKETA